MSSTTKPFEEKMNASVNHLVHELASIRAGRANPAILDKVAVDYYGSPTPIQQIAAVAVAEARILTISPWDRSMLKPISKAIQTSDIGINPIDDGQVIRLVFPAPTEERRKQLTKDVKKQGEDAKTAVRNIRRDADGHDTCVVLLHDTKATGQTVKALPDIIAYFKEQGYTFCTVAQMEALK